MTVELIRFPSKDLLQRADFFFDAPWTPHRAA